MELFDSSVPEIREVFRTAGMQERYLLPAMESEELQEIFTVARRHFPLVCLPEK